ncbi:MAG: hypothetical protein K2Y42_20525 [Hyphomicrobium sp.]|jgi:hypothetical protein|uniref:hypothetical protein n=1 Tax=Hyphomicrobium sp. TaxID=82 RepID=UPI0025BF2155|nr:hypothetical protein [Hyphomicrobium sp.]MBX9865135.1 hypothetical protein [Hyphomicrobium sp.]
MCRQAIWHKATIVLASLLAGTNVRGAELGGVKLEAPAFSAVMLHNDGCRRSDRLSQTDAKSVHGVYEQIALSLVWIELSRVSERFGVKGFMLAADILEETFLCEDRRFYIIASERAGEQRVMGVTLLYCSGDEGAGVDVLYDKLGIEKPTGVQGTGVPEASLFGSETKGFQKAIDPFSPAVAENIAVTAFKQPGGCRGAGLTGAFMYGLSFISKPLYAEAAARYKAQQAKELQAIKPPPRL